MLHRFACTLLMITALVMPGPLPAAPAPPTLSACANLQSAPAQLPPPASSGAALRMVASLGGGVDAVAVSADGATVAFGEGAALAVARVSSGGAPLRLARLSLPDVVQDIELVGSVALVASGRGGLQVVDLSAPDAPALRASLALPGLPKAVRVDGPRAYVASAGLEGGLFILDISDIAQPRLLSQTAVFGSASGVAVADGRAYVAAGYGGGLQIFELPADGPPVARGTLITPGPALDVAVRGGRAYLAAGFCGLQSVDLSDPAAPTLLGAVDAGDATALSLSGSTIYVAGGSSGLRSFSLSGAAPAPATGVSPQGVVSDLALGSAGQIYLAAGAGGLLGYSLVQAPVVDNPPTAYLPSGQIAALVPEAVGLTVAGPLYLGEAGGFAALDLSQPGPPTLRASLPLSSTVLDMELADGRAYLAGGAEGLTIVDLSEPLSPTLLASLPLTGTTSAVAVLSDTLYAAAGSGGLAVVDLSEPNAPQLSRLIDTPGQALGLALTDRLVLVADGGSLRVFAAAGLTLTGVLSATGEASFRSVAVRGELAYLTGAGGLAVVDLADPSRPTLLRQLGSFSGRRIAIADEKLVVAAGVDGLYLFELADPTRPDLRTRYDTPGTALDVQISGELIYAADSGGGLQVFETIELPYRVGLPLMRS